jgi:hypothetical protein
MLFQTKKSVWAGFIRPCGHVRNPRVSQKARDVLTDKQLAVSAQQSERRAKSGGATRENLENDGNCPVVERARVFRSPMTTLTEGLTGGKTRSRDSKVTDGGRDGGTDGLTETLSNTGWPDCGTLPFSGVRTPPASSTTSCKGLQ